MEKITYITYDAVGNEITIIVPTKFEICDHCRGEGKHDHPAFNNGFSKQDLEEDPDFAEEYFRGSYDVPCEKCNGLRVISVPDESACTEKQIDDYYKQLWDEGESDRI